MIDNNHELTIGELDAVNGGLGSVMGMINQIMQTVLRTENPDPPPTQSGPAQQFQQVLNSLGTHGQA